MFEILAVNGKFVTDEVPARKEDELEVLEIKGNASERAARCAEMRGFKESVAKAKRREEWLNKIVDGVCNLLFGTVFFSVLLVALWLGSM